MASTTKHGVELLQDPALNKSTAFAEAERQALGLVGLVPDLTETQDLQLQRVNSQLAQKTTDLERYIYLINLLDHNETLFYRTIMSDPSRQSKGHSQELAAERRSVHLRHGRRPDSRLG